MNLTRQTRREMMKSSARLGLAGLSMGAGFLNSSSLWGKPSPRSGQRFKIGACDWTLGKRTNPEALEVARRLGLDGIMVDMGDPRSGFPLLQPELQNKYLARSKELQVEIASLALGILNQLPYKSEPGAQQWVADSIEVSRALGTHVVLLAFFSKGDLKNDKKGTDAVTERLKEIAPKAEKAGVVLGVESWLSAADHMAILDKVGSSAVQVYYDLGNSHKMGYDIYKEIRFLGISRSFMPRTMTACLERGRSISPKSAGPWMISTTEGGCTSKVVPAKRRLVPTDGTCGPYSRKTHSTERGPLAASN